MSNEKDIMNSFQMKWWESLSLDEQEKWLEIFSKNSKIDFKVKKKPPKEISPKTKEDIERWNQGNIEMQIEDNFQLKIEDKFDTY